jgi:hypothetical protein
MKNMLVNNYYNNITLKIHKRSEMRNNKTHLTNYLIKINQNINNV